MFKLHFAETQGIFFKGSSEFGQSAGMIGLAEAGESLLLPDKKFKMIKLVQKIYNKDFFLV